MAYLIGTDEAGYGPNFGPLAVGASVWRVNDASLNGLDDADLYDRLGDVVTRNPVDACGDRIAIADSKLLYRPGKELDLLERGVLTALSIRQRDTCTEWPMTFRGLLHSLRATESDIQRMPWYRGYNDTLPSSREVTIESLRATQAAWTERLAAAEIRLVDLRARLVFPEEFNDEVSRFDSKGAVLSHATLDLVADLVSCLPEEPVRIVCDKHGGRSKYGPLLQPRFGDRLVRVMTEGRRCSSYEVGTPSRPIEVSFQVGGEDFLPSALASMTAKYLRELCMRGFNRFWRTHLPHLKPTAGYPVDAKRFKREIQSTQEQLGIRDHDLWRDR